MIMFPELSFRIYPEASLRRCGGVVTSWSVRSSMDRVVLVRALAGVTVVLLGKTLTPSQCHSPPRSINGYWRIVGETQQIGGSDRRWASIPSRQE